MVDRSRLKIVASFAVSMLLAASLVIPTMSAQAKPEDWLYVKKDPCAGIEEKSKVDNNQPPDGGSGSENSENAWLTPGTSAYAVAKEIFDTLTDEYGWSGAAACGVLGNVRGESGFIPDRAQGVGTLRFGMNSKEPPAGLSGGGGGLFQFTPYTKFTDSEYWGKIDSDGWGIKNQIAYMWNAEFADKSVMLYVKIDAYGLITKQPGSIENWLSTDDPAEAAMYFFVGYERAAVAHPERREWAAAANAVFNADKVTADPSKWQFNDGSHGTPGIDGSQSAADKEKAGECDRFKKGVVSGDLLEVAKQYAADDTIGYSQSQRMHNPDMDCSSFVWYCIVDSKTQTKEEMGNTPFATPTMGAILESIGWDQSSFTSMDQLQPGDVLVYNRGDGWGNSGHTAIYLGEGRLAEASGDKDGMPGDSTPGGIEVKVSNFWGAGEWQDVYRKVA